MAILTVIEPGDTLLFVPVDANGDTFDNDGTPLIMLNCPTQREITVQSGQTGLPDDVRPCGPGTYMAPRYDPLRWNRADIGRLVFTIDDPDGVTVIVLRPGVVGFGDNESLSGSLIE